MIYYTKFRETTQAFIVGTQTTWVAQKQVSRSWPQTGQEERGRDLPAIDVPEMTIPPDYKPLGWEFSISKIQNPEAQHIHRTKLRNPEMMCTSHHLDTNTKPVHTCTHHKTCTQVFPTIWGECTISKCSKSQHITNPVL